MSEIDGSNFDFAASHTADSLTNALILHPIACGVTFIALLLACLPGIWGALLGSAMTALAWILTLVVMAIDFALFGVSIQPTRVCGRMTNPCSQDNQGTRQQRR